MTSTERKLPDYLGFGTLKRHSVNRVRNGLTAEYVSGNEIVYTVEWTEGRCELTEFCNGEVIDVSVGNNLSQAFVRLVSTSEPLHHPRFVQLATCFARAGNIFFVYPQRTGGCLFFPSGYIFLLRQPVVESNYSAWQKLKNGLNHDETKFRFKLHAEILGAAFRVMIDGTIQKKSVVIAQLGCLPHNLARAVEYCQRIGILSEEREFRMTICDVSQIPHSLNCYEGDRAKGVLSFSLYEFGTRSHQILEQEADSKFFSIWRTDRQH